MIDGAGRLWCSAPSIICCVLAGGWGLAYLRGMRTLSALALCAVVAGCAGEGTAASREFALEPVFRIGVVEGPPEFAFGRIATVLPMADGGFFTCDGNDTQVRRYGPDGAFLGAVGRQGAGPGEYSMCMDLALLGDSMLIVSDPSNARFAMFSVDGTFRRMLNASVFPGFGGDNAFFIDTAGFFWKRGAVVGTEAREHPGGEFGGTQYVILDPRDGTRVDSVPVPGSFRSRLGLSFVLSTSEGMYSFLPPDTVWGASSRGDIAVAGTDAYRITIRGRDGSARIVSRTASPVAYAEPERAEWTAWTEFFARQSPGAQYPAAPQQKAVLRGVRFDDDGRLWVHVHVTAEQRPIPPRPAGDSRPLLTWRERNTYDLFDSGSGEFLGRVAFPYASQLMAVRGDRVWLRQEGESGEQVLGVYALTSAE